VTDSVTKLKELIQLWQSKWI